MSTGSTWVDEFIPCRDPECRGSAEPEGDEETRYYACTTCGFEFGFTRVKTTDGACQQGITEPALRSLNAVPAGAPVYIGSIGRRPE